MRFMLKIRLQRVGRKHEPSFRLVLTDSKNSTKSGKYLETLGNYDSRRGENAVVNSDRVKYWMSKGAQVTPTVNNLLINKKVIESKKINVLPRKKPITTESQAPAQAQAPAETPAQPEETKNEAAEEVSV